MLRRAITTTLLTTGLLAGAAQAQQATPQATQPAKPVHKITSEPGQLDMGWLRPKEKREGHVLLRNTSNEVINLLRVTSNCSCTVGALDEEQKILRPGQATEIAVSLKATPNSGPMVQRAYVWYEGSRTPYELVVKADVSHAVKTDPTFVNIMGDTKHGAIRLESLDGRPFKVTSVDGGSPSVFNLDGEPVSPYKPATEFLVEFDYRGVADEDLDRWFMIETDHPEARELPLRVIHSALFRVAVNNPTWSFGQDRFILGRMQAGDEVTREFTLKRIEKLDDITAIAIDDAGLDAEILEKSSTGSDVTLKVRFVATGAVTGLIKSRLKITAEGQEHGADVIARVEGAS